MRAAQSAGYLIYSEADFEVFRPAGATRCTDGVKFDTKEGTEVHGPLLHAKFHPHRCNDKCIGPPKLKLFLLFNQNVEYKRPAVAYPLQDFKKNCTICTSFQAALAVEVSLDLLKGLWSYGGFNLMGVWLPPNFQCPLAAKLRQIPKRFRGARTCSRFSITMPNLGDRISPAAGAAKNVESFLFVRHAFSVRHAFERQSLCARFHHEVVEIQK